MALWNFLVLLLPCFVYGTTREPLTFTFYKNDAFVPLTNDGQCEIYDGKILAHQSDWYSPDYCEKVSCRVLSDKGHRMVRGCVPSTPVAVNCSFVSRKGFYPDCCNGEVLCGEHEREQESESEEELIARLQELLDQHKRRKK